MKVNNYSMVLNKVEDMSLEQTPMPLSPGSNEVLLRTLCVGICGSDVHYWKHGMIGKFVVKDPIVLGHETSAEVIEIGPDVNHLKVGDRVCTEPGIPCRKCAECKEGTYNLCNDVRFHATPPYHGTLTKYFLHPADYTFKIGNNMSDEEGAMIEPLTVAVYACKRAQVSVGNDVLITGAGPIGLFTIMVAKALGANRVVVTDINEQRLELAHKIGASHSILITKDTKENKVVEEIVEMLGRMPDMTIECSGAPSSTRLGFLATKQGGNVVIVGHGPHDVSVPIVNAAMRELNIMGSFRYRNCFPTTIALVNSGKVDLKQMISHRFTFDKCEDAFRAASSGEGIKVMIQVKDEND